MSCVKCGVDSGQWSLCRDHYQEAKDNSELDVAKVEIKRWENVRLGIPTNAFDHKGSDFWMAYLNGFCVYMNAKTPKDSMLCTVVEMEKVEHLKGSPETVTRRTKYVRIISTKGELKDDAPVLAVAYWEDIKSDSGKWSIPRTRFCLAIVEDPEIPLMVTDAGWEEYQQDVSKPKEPIPKRGSEQLSQLFQGRARVSSGR